VVPGALELSAASIVSGGMKKTRIHMYLQSARDLKQQLMSEVVVPFTERAARIEPVRARAEAVPAGPAADGEVMATTFSVGARSIETVPHLQRSVALGVARTSGEYRLAVRVQRPALMASPLVEHLVRQAKGEADVRLVGRIDKRARARTARAAAAPWYRSNTRPLAIGASVGHVLVTAGTIGAFVRRGNATFVLSNNHVLANEDAARAGDWIVQRGTLDGGRDPRDRVARLRFWVRLKKRAANVVDAALAEVQPGIAIDAARLRDLTGTRDRRLAGVGPAFLDEGDTVYKIGRTTGATEGRVTAFDVDNVVVNYDAGNLRFDGQIEIEGTGNRPFSDGGDSGSLIVDGAMQAVALLFAGGEIGGSNGLGLTYANPMHYVLSETRATLLVQ
jgi:hypothetical protein